MKRLPALALLVFLALFAVAGCGGDDGDGGGSVAEFCEEFEAADTAGDPLEDVESGDVEGAKEALTEFEGTIGGLADAAPDEISDDVEELRDYLGSYNEAISDAGSEEEFQRLSNEFEEENPAPEGTVQRLEDYTNENCDSGGDTTG